MKVALVHDYLTQRGGAERVVLSMLKAFPGAPLYTSLYEPTSTFPEFGDHDIRPMWINRSRTLRADHRRGLPLYPYAFSHLKLDPEPNVVLCSSSGFAHGVHTTGCKVVYCYTPARWLYDEAAAYLAGWSGATGTMCRAATPRLQAWDRRAARSADSYLTSSSAMAAAVRRAYGIEATVLPPPVHVDARGDQQAVPGETPGFLLAVSRLLAYKHVEPIVTALRQLPDFRLVVVGEGPERDRLLALAPPNVTILGRVNDAELRWLYANCVGLVSASFEDYGLTPIEAGAFGKPVAVLRAGGFLDTVIEGTTGVFFDAPTPTSVQAGLTELLHAEWDREALVAHAALFDETRFVQTIRAAVVLAKARTEAPEVITSAV